MLNFEEYRRLNEAGEEQFSTIQQEPEVPQQSNGLVPAALQGAGLGVLASLLGAVALKKLNGVLSARGYGTGVGAVVRYVKNSLGIKPYENHTFTPEEQKKIADRLNQMVGQVNAGPSAGNPLLDERINEFSGRIFNLGKVSARAKLALSRAISAFTANQSPLETDVKLVVDALAKGAGSDEFKVWFKQNISKATDVNKKVAGPGIDGKKGRRELQYTKYEMGKSPMTKIDFNAIIRYYHSIYGYKMPNPNGQQNSNSVQPSNPLDPEAEAKRKELEMKMRSLERDARGSNLNRTATALQNNNPNGY